jgi:hypothetical protein
MYLSVYVGIIHSVFSLAKGNRVGAFGSVSSFSWMQSDMDDQKDSEYGVRIECLVYDAKAAWCGD